MKNGNSASVVESSLTELAFIFFFILLTFSIWKITDTNDELTDKEIENTLLNEKAELVTHENKVLKETIESLGLFKDLAHDFDPNELFIELAEGRLAKETLQAALIEKEKLEGQLDQLTDTAGKLINKEELQKKLDAYSQINELLNEYKLENFGELKDFLNVSKNIEGQNVNLRTKLKKLGNGLDHPPCWADENGKIEYTYKAYINEKSVVFKNGWPESRDKQARSSDAIMKVLGSYNNNPAMWEKTKSIFDDSVKNECRYFVLVYDQAISKESFKNYLSGIETHFYKFLSNSN